jgi:DNA-binding transcriptional LysR family regulator
VIPFTEPPSLAFAAILVDRRARTRFSEGRMAPIQKSKPLPPMAPQRADWSDLRIFYAVASRGGFSAAARAIGQTQPTVSRRMEELEARLGVKLLNRSPHGLSLTEAGETIFQFVQTMEHSSNAIERLVFNADKREEGLVNIACTDGVASLALAPAVADFFRVNPKISLALECGLWPTEPLPGSVDVTLQFDRIASPDVIAEPVATLHYALYGAPSYFDLYGRPRSLPEAAQHRYIHHIAQNRESSVLPSTTPALQNLADRKLTTNSSAAMVDAIRFGAGIGPIPTSVGVLYPDLEMLELGEIAAIDLWMCVHRDVAKSARIRRVTEWLKSVFDRRTKPWYRAEFVHPSEFELAARAPAPARASLARG